ncbi:MAG: adenylyltransferase/cytidyltransferase family protein [Nanobdellota archaeon]
MEKVMVFGTFDMLHEGHKYLFRRAKQYGDYLIAVISRDKTTKKVKGFLPEEDENTRKGKVQKFVDKALLGDKEDPYRIIEKEKPDIICLGYDQDSFTTSLEEELRKRGLKSRIIRLDSHKPEKYKSSHFR